MKIPVLNYHGYIILTITYMTPEEKARERIDSLFEKAEWVNQNYHRLNPGISTGLSVREFLHGFKRIDIRQNFMFK